MAAIKEVTDLPVHFHTHDTSGGSIASALAMAAAGCHIIDFATAAMANCTSQPSLNAFLAAMAGDERDPGINYLAVEPYDAYWAKVRGPSVHQCLVGDGEMDAWIASVSVISTTTRNSLLYNPPKNTRQVREMYAPFECGMKSGTARVYDHEIPGGQYSNLMVQVRRDWVAVGVDGWMDGWLGGLFESW